MSYAYLDSSAVVKLVAVEPETVALQHYVLNQQALLSSRLTATEVERAVARVGGRRLLDTAGAVLDALVLLDMTRTALTLASSLSPSGLRTLDALHLATALGLTLENLEFVTYDGRLAIAAASAGLSVRQPGLARKP